MKNNKISKLITATAIALFIFSGMFITKTSCQNTNKFIKNIILPDTNLAFTGISDLVFTNNKLFAYTASGIIVFNDSLNVLKYLPFPDRHFGKFVPLLYHPKFWVDDANLLAVKETFDDTAVFAVTPYLNIVRINTTAPYEISIAVDKAPDIDSILPMNSNNIIRYDNNHKRLYWVIHGRSPVNSIGKFHYKSRYLAIYHDTIKDNINQLNLIYHESRPFYFAGDSVYQDRNISDLKFNSNNNYFYVSKFSRIDTWEVANNDTAILKRVVSAYDYLNNINNYKFGKMLYVNNPLTGIHKIIAVPVSYGEAEYSATKDYFIFVLDGDSLQAPVQLLSVPNIQILDATILPQNNDLVISFSPNPRFMADNTFSGDIAVYHFDSASARFDSIPYLKFSTNHSAGYGNYDYNASFKLLNLSDNEILISKKDELVKLFLGTENNYNNIQVLSGNNNYFMKAVKGDGKIFVANLTKNAIELFNDSLNHIKTVKTGFSPFHIKADATGRYLCFYNKQTVENPTLCIYDTQNQNLNLIKGISKPIGDCIYDTYINRFIVSENGEQDANILVVNPASDTIESSHPIYDSSSGIVKHATTMYLSQDANLFISTNMAINSSTNPSIIVLDAMTFQHKSTVPCQVQLNNDSAQFYNTHFAFSEENGSTYAAIFPQKITFNPYNAEYNTLVDSISEHFGMMVKINSDMSNTAVSFIYPTGKIIFPYRKGDGNRSNGSQFAGKIYILSDSLIESDLGLNLSSLKRYRKLIDLVYDENNDVMYGLADNYEGSYHDFRKAVVYKIDYSNKVLTFETMNSFPGQAASFFYNPFDNKIYLHMKFDANKLGNTPGYLASFKVSNPSQITTVFLKNEQYNQNRSYYTELDHSHDYHYFANYLTAPYINPYDTTIYLPNGGHSNVSLVSFTPDEQLTLNPVGNTNESFTWVSFPRLANNNATPVNDVLGGDNIVPNTYVQNSNLESLPSGDSVSSFNYYDGSVWPASQDLQYIKSTLGYKLSLKYNANPNQQIKRYLHGNVLSPSTSIDSIYGNGRENWIGYWLYQEQSPFDAIADDVLDELTEIKAQDWFCYKDWSMGQQTPQWICGVGKGINAPNLNYGDMVILKSNSGISDFQWQWGDKQTFSEIKSATEHYQYNEEDDYTAYLIEIDTANRPQEIGAFIGSTCIGASKVLPSDTLVLIRGYDTDTTGTVYFVEYFNSQKSSKPALKEYYVKNHYQPGWQKRTINAAEKEGHYLISFKRKETVSPVDNDNDFALKVYPNPAQNRLTVEYTTSGDANTTLEVFDVTGKKIVKLQNRLTAGMHQNIINTQHFKNGIYLLRVSTGNQTAVKRFVVNK